MLPGESGKELLPRFKRERPSLPVVILTARSDLEDVVECMRLGAADYVHKPFDPIRLVTSVKNACQQGTLLDRVSTLASELQRESGLAAILGSVDVIMCLTASTALAGLVERIQVPVIAAWLAVLMLCVAGDRHWR